MDGAEGGAQAPGSPTGDGRTSGLNGGEAFRDPFDPASWQNPPSSQPMPAELVEAEAIETEADQLAMQDHARGDVEAQVTDPALAAGDAAQPNEQEPETASEEPASVPPTGLEPGHEPVTPGADRAGGPAEGSEPPPSDLQQEIARALHEAPGSPRAPLIEVERTGEGVLISLTDDLNFGMFAVGSAEPHPEVIRIMAKIANVLKARPGQIVVRGHTDARPFRSESYDNWRLSSARAHMAYYMLVRGGLDENRFESIEGYADRRLKLRSDPEAAENRRIEILVKEDAP
ncbi:MAG TPA: OmpA family protein, partial [Propylenella sp.]|nr:OmpA family protein [Propylenella sp.]